MKIAIVGAHGVGKTSLSERLAEALRIKNIPDVAIEAFKKGFPINENTPAETQFWLFSRQLELERNFADHWIADKCLIDYSVYADIIFSDFRIKELLAEMVRRNLSYDFVFYLPIEFPLEDNGIRSLDPEFQRIIDRRYREILNNWGIGHQIVSGSLEERFNQTMKIIKK